MIYSTDTAITFDVSSLATSSTLLAGRESTQIDNTTTLYDRVQVYCDGITGGATVPTVNQVIALYVWGSTVSLATTPINALDGTDSDETLTHAQALAALRRVSAAAVLVATASLVYQFQPFEVSQYFGGVVPPFWGLYLAHNHTGSLAAGQSDIWSYRGVTY